MALASGITIEFAVYNPGGQGEQTDRDVLRSDMYTYSSGEGIGTVWGTVNIDEAGATTMVLSKGYPFDPLVSFALPIGAWTKISWSFDFDNGISYVYVNGDLAAANDVADWGGTPEVSKGFLTIFAGSGLIFDELRRSNIALYTAGTYDFSYNCTPGIIIPPPTMTIAQPSAIMPYPSIKPSYVPIPVTITVWTMLDMATRAWGSEYNAPDKNIYVFSNGRGFDSTDLSRNGVYGVIGDDGDFNTLLIDNNYPDMQTELLTDNVPVSSPPNVGNPAQFDPATWTDHYELFTNQ